MSISPAKAADALMQALAAAGCTDDENLDSDFPHEIVHEEVFDTGGDHFQGGDFVQHCDVQSGVEVGPNFGGGDMKVDVEDQAMEEEDEDGDEVRPDLTWNQLIAQAIHDDGVEKRASLLDIYKSIEDRYPFFKGLTSVNPTTNFKMINRWQRQIKAQLRESKIFHKLVPVVNSEGLPSYWTMEYAAYQQVFKSKKQGGQSTFKSKEAGQTRRTAVKEASNSEPSSKSTKGNDMHCSDMQCIANKKRLHQGSEKRQLVVVSPKIEVKDEPLDNSESNHSHFEKTIPMSKGTYKEKEDWRYKSKKMADTVRNRARAKGYLLCVDMFGEDLFKCIQCEYTSKSQENVSVHINVAHVKKTFYCNICGRPYQSYKVLKEHLTYFHKKQCYPCTIEGCKFKSADAEAIAIHYNEKHQSSEVPPAYRPIHPSQRLTTASSKRVGMKGASKTFAPSLERLIDPKVDLDSGIPTGFSCKLCERQFHKKDSVALHIKLTHMGIKMPCPTPNCSFESGYVHLVKSHVIEEHGWEEISCVVPNCRFVTLRDSKMQKHLVDIHKATYDEKTHTLKCRESTGAR